MIKIKNLSKEKPKEPWDVKICRTKSILGNPYILYNESERDLVCDMYEKWFDENILMLKDELQRLIEIYKTYHQLNLFCWCAPKRCHGETIKKYIEEQKNK